MVEGGICPAVHGRDDFDALPGAGDADVEASPASVLVEDSEVGGDLSGFVWSVADAEDDDVALVALHGFQGPDEEAVEAVFLVEVAVEVASVLARLGDRVDDGVGLRHREGDDARG